MKAPAWSVDSTHPHGHGSLPVAPPPTLPSPLTSAGRVLRSGPGAPSGQQRCCKSGWVGARGFLGPAPALPAHSIRKTLCRLVVMSPSLPAGARRVALGVWWSPGMPGPRTRTVPREVWLAGEGGRESGGLRGPRGVHPIFKPQKVTQTANKRTRRSTPSPALTRAPLEGLPGVQLPQDACCYCPQPGNFNSSTENLLVGYLVQPLTLRKMKSRERSDSPRRLGRAPVVRRTAIASWLRM